MVSIIVPVYNSEKYLCECVDSVLAQTYHDWELIIVDDGSTDSSSSIADNYAASDQRIKVLHVANGGPSHARNNGLLHACGDYICFVDADDMLHPQAIEYMLIGITTTNADMFICTMHRGITPAFKPLKNSPIQNLSSEETIEASLYQDGRAVNSIWGKIYRQSILSNLHFEPGLLYEDLEFFYRVCIKCQLISITNADIYFYRDTPGSITNKWTDKRLDVLDVVDRIEAYMAENCPTLLSAARDRKLSANFNMFILATANGRHDVARKCWKVITKYRFTSLTDPKVRLKNKAGIILSYLGSKVFSTLSCLQK